MGILKDLDGELVKPLNLLETTYLPALKGLLWDTDHQVHNFPDDLKRVVKRSKIHVSIILKESDEKTKFDLFQRLNTGGSQLSPQEVRNCILVMENQNFYEWVRSLSRYDSFVQTIALSDKLLAESYDMEQVLRFLILAEATEKNLAAVGDLGGYLDTKMIEFAKDQNFDKAGWQRRFCSTFDCLAKTIGQNAFRRYSVEKERHEGGFLVSQFEAVTCGVAWNLERGTLRNDLGVGIADIWLADDYTGWVGSGITAARRLRRTVPFARQHFANS